MGRTTGMLQKGYTAALAIPRLTIAKWGAADGTVTPAADGAAFLVGIQAEIDCDVGDRASMTMIGNIEDVIYGGNVTRGQPLTAGAGGKAVVAAPAAGANVYIIGFAEVSGVANDIGSVLIAPGIMQG